MRATQCKHRNNILVGETEGSLDATNTHSSLGTVLTKYAMVAKHWASIDGKENAGPQTCSSRTILLALLCLFFCPFQFRARVFLTAEFMRRNHVTHRPDVLYPSAARYAMAEMRSYDFPFFDISSQLTMTLRGYIGVRRRGLLR